MADIIPHHYPLSPFSEKTRLDLGLESLSYHSVTIPIWFARQNGGAAAEAMLPLPPLRAWYDRVGAIGHGTPRDMTAADALAAAKTSDPGHPGFDSEPDDPPPVARRAMR